MNSELRSRTGAQLDYRIKIGIPLIIGGVCVAALLHADQTESPVSVYSRVAAGHPFKVTSTRASFVRDGHVWTIVGAGGRAHGNRAPARSWGVGSAGFGLLAVRQPVSDEKILPFDDPVPNTVVSKLVQIAAAQGEVEPFSVVLRSGDLGLTNVNVIAGPLVNVDAPALIIPSSAIDLRGVKVWYQADSSLRRGDGEGKTLTPELLLHDLGLVEVDFDNQVNLIRDLDQIEDSLVLQPFDMQPRRNQQIWGNVSVPVGAAPGIYEGRVTLKFAVGGTPTEVQFTLRLMVHGFELAPSGVEHALYYLGRLFGGAPIVDGQRKTRLQMESELRDLASHGVTNATLNHEPLDDPMYGVFTEQARLIKEQLNPMSGLLYLDWHQRYVDDADKYARHILRIREIARRIGFSEVHVYGNDEASSSAIGRQLDAIRPLREKGIRFFAANGHPEYRVLSQAYDVLVLPRSRENLIPSVEGRFKAIWAYNDPQAGEEKPGRYRDRYGFSLWLAGFDGACNYAYQSGELVWDDWQEPRWRPHAMTYPTLSGPIPTLQWEGYREAIDDLRYLTTAFATIGKALPKGTADQRRQRVMNLLGLKTLPESPAALREWLARFVQRESRGSSVGMADVQKALHMDQQHERRKL